MSDEERQNVFEHGVVPTDIPIIYKDLSDEISTRQLKYDGSYREQELNYLQPQLEHIGYRDIEWMDGERDSFGPLTRVCKTTDHFGKTVWFVYG